jgi:hypothetical protein
MRSRYEGVQSRTMQISATTINTIAFIVVVYVEPPN